MTTTTTPTPDTVLMTECPGWCTYPAGHDLDGMTPGNGRTHTGPEFGIFHTSAYEYGEDGRLDPYVLVSPNEVGRDEFPHLLADAVAAAKWLEGQA